MEIRALRYLTMGRALCLLVWLALLLQMTSGKGKVTLQFIKYENPSGKDSKGGCCEGLFNCGDLCDPIFKICYTELPSTSRKCPIETGHYENTNKIQFGTTIGGKTKNPMTFSFDHFKTGLRVEVNAMDRDTGGWFGASDDIETVSHDIAGALAFNSTLPSTPVTMTGSRITLQVRIRVQCDPHYYDQGCGTYCRAEDSPNHYICTNTGKKICLSHWIGTDCSHWDYCHNNTCRNGAICRNKPTNYSCSCVKDYTGKFCEILITSTSKSTSSTSTTTTTTTTIPSTTPTTTTTQTTITTTTTTIPTTTTNTQSSTSTSLTTATTTVSTSSTTGPTTTSAVTVASIKVLTVTSFTTTSSSPKDIFVADLTLPIILGSGGLVALISCLLMAFLLRRRCRRKVKPKKQEVKPMRTKAKYNLRRPRR